MCSIVCVICFPFFGNLLYIPANGIHDAHKPRGYGWKSEICALVRNAALEAKAQRVMPSITRRMSRSRAAGGRTNGWTDGIDDIDDWEPDSLKHNIAAEWLAGFLVYGDGTYDPTKHVRMNAREKELLPQTVDVDMSVTTAHNSARHSWEIVGICIQTYNIH